MSAVSAWRIAVRIARSMSAPSSRARNWQQKIAHYQAVLDLAETLDWLRYVPDHDPQDKP
jgi:hypothetical protein